jgi:pSer/pThr/pTyr-binding forkhead associated (FHA) protein
VSTGSELETLAARIAPLPALVPEQITATQTDETDAVLIDAWARLHRLAPTTIVGREPERGLAIRESSVSRKHATLTFDDDHDCWYVSDHESTNGTYVEGSRIEPHRPHRIGDRSLIRFGEIGFVLVVDRATLPETRVPFPPSTTVKSQTARGELVLHKPTLEGAGVVTFGGHSVTLGSTQFALLALLAERYLSSESEGSEIRGFVRSIELITSLPWNTARPEDNHVKQQVRRLRRAFESIGLVDLIESRQGFGYRLRVRPTIER